MNKRNYQRELEMVVEWAMSEKKVPSLLLHSCCAPCSSYVLEYLSKYFFITVYYYNPNIYPASEYDLRVEEQRDLIERMQVVYPVRFVAGEYVPEEFYEAVKGFEKEPEGAKRCFCCYELRLSNAAKMAADGGFDYVTTTLSISPMKNAEKLNEIGERVAKEYGVNYLPSDFKKKEGYKRSTQLSKEYGLYRQDYCGCVYSMARQNSDKQTGV